MEKNRREIPEPDARSETYTVADEDVDITLSCLTECSCSTVEVDMCVW